LSLHHALTAGLAGRLSRPVGAEPRPAQGAGHLADRSVAIRDAATMRLLEFSLALLAMATALLIGLGR
jgi:hypothetical protein